MQVFSGGDERAQHFGGACSNTALGPLCKEAMPSDGWRRLGTPNGLAHRVKPATLVSAGPGFAGLLLDRWLLTARHSSSRASAGPSPTTQRRPTFIKPQRPSKQLQAQLSRSQAVHHRSHRWISPQCSAPTTVPQHPQPQHQPASPKKARRADYQETSGGCATH